MKVEKFDWSNPLNPMAVQYFCHFNQPKSHVDNGIPERMVTTVTTEHSQGKVKINIIKKRKDLESFVLLCRIYSAWHCDVTEAKL